VLRSCVIHGYACVHEFEAGTFQRHSLTKTLAATNDVSSGKRNNSFSRRLTATKDSSIGKKVKVPISQTERKSERRIFSKRLAATTRGVDRR
jgi:ribosome assembly protein YihI (activator of Der GTPase)